MKAFLVAAVFLSITPVQAKTAEIPSPVKSTEPITFASEKDHKLLELGKSDAFRGVIARTEEKSDLRLVDLYSFKEESLTMNEDLCKKFLTQIFGPLDKISLKVEKIEIYPSHTGKTCDARVTDPDKEGKVPERRVIAGFLNANPTALVFRLSKRSSGKETESVRKFWDTLR